MVFRNKTGEYAAEHHLLTSADLDLNDFFCTASLAAMRPRDQPITDDNRPMKTQLRRPNNHIWVVDGEHARVVGETKNKAAVHQPLIIGGHLGQRQPTHLGTTLGERQRAATKARIDAKVGLRLHQRRPYNTRE